MTVKKKKKKGIVNVNQNKNKKTVPEIDPHSQKVFHWVQKPIS